MEIRIIRSKKRRKTIEARMVDGVLEIRAPASISDVELQPYIDNLQHRMERRKKVAGLDHQALEKRAQQLNRKYFADRLKWRSIRWVTNQDKRFGSCTPEKGTIRISHRVNDLPKFVQDYVIIHELAHLEEANHGKRYWELVNRYQKTERARGYLMAVGLEDMDD